MSDIANLSIQIDSSPAVAAAQALDQFAASGAKASTAAQTLAKATQQAATSSAATAQSIAASAVQSASASAAMISAARNSGALGAANKLTAYQSQQLGYQLNDLFVQIQAGQSPLTALIQQGSQLNGTFGGIGGSLRAVSTLFTASRVAIGGVAAAIGAVGLGIYEGAQQSAALEKALALTGNAAGVTASQVDTMAKSIGTSTKAGAGTARDALQELIASGRFGGTALSAAGQAAVQFSKLTGESLDDVTKKFTGLADNTAKGAAALNDQYHFLSAAQLEQIKDLDEQGDHTKALTTVFDALNSRLTDAAGKVGTLGSAWNALKGYVNSASDALAGAGRTPSTQDRLDSVREQLSTRGRSGAGGPSSTIDTNPRSSTFGTSEKQVLLDREKSLTVQLGLESSIAIQAGQMVESDRAASAFSKLKEASLTKQEKLARDIANANAQADNANRGGEIKVTAADRAKVIADIRDRYKEPAGPADDPSKALLDNATKTIQRQVQEQKDLLGERNRFIDLYNSQNLLSIKDYYAARKTAADESLAGEIAGLDREVAALRKYQTTAGDKDTAEAQGKIDAAVAKKATLQRQVSFNSIELSVQEGRAQQALKQQFDSVNASLLERQNRLRDAAAITFEIQYKDVTQKATAEGDSTTLDRVAQLRASTLAQAEFNEKATASGTILAQLQFQEDAVAIARQKGTVGELAGLAQVGDYRRSAIAQLQEIVDAEEKLANVNPGDSGLAARALQARSELEKLKGAIDPLGDKFRTVFEGSATNALTEFISGTKGAKGAFSDFANSVVQDIARIAAQRLAEATFGSGSFLGNLLGIGASVVTGTPAALPGVVAGGSGLILKKAAGGQVRPSDFTEVGERGPEILTSAGRQYLLPGASGTVTPNDKLGGGDVHITATYNIGEGVSRAEVIAGIQQANTKLKADILRSKRMGGQFA